LIQLIFAGDRRLELPSLVYAVHGATTLLGCLCEFFAFPENLLPQKEKITFGMMYGPILAVQMLMAMDMYKRVRQRLDNVKKE
jgi:hypothetical protein